MFTRQIVILSLFVNKMHQPYFVCSSLESLLWSKFKGQSDYGKDAAIDVDARAGDRGRAGGIVVGGGGGGCGAQAFSVLLRAAANTHTLLPHVSARLRASAFPASVVSRREW